MNAADLQERLARGEPTTVLDVRPADERDEWRIPGSTWVDAYHEIKAGDMSRLDSLDLPTGQPIVTVCAGGITAAKATEHLRSKGLNAHTLQGGMGAWNLACNLAETSLPGGTRAVQVRRTGKGCLSHVLVNDGEALVVDAGVDPDVYERIARDLDARIVGVLDTHIHADHLSRTPRIARHLGVPYHLGASADMQAPYAPLHDGDEVPFGDDHIQVFHTPGHTWESSTYRIGDILLTGDTLFIDGVGRPDLGAGKTEVRARARALHDSLERIMAHDGATRVLPAHASQPLPFDDVQWSASLDAIRARVNLLGLGAEDFVAAVEARLGDVPPSYHRMVELNRLGEWPDEEAPGLEAGANRCAAGPA